MHNRMFIQIYALAVWEECLALSLSASLIFPAFAPLFLPHVGLSPSRSRVRSSLFCLSCDAVSELFCKYSEYTWQQSYYKKIKSLGMCS